MEFIIGRFMRKQTDKTAAFVGLSGVHGCGKKVMANDVANILRANYGLETFVLHLDDFYLTHEEQVLLAAQHPDNPLVQQGGSHGEHTLSVSILFAYILLPHLYLPAVGEIAV